MPALADLADPVGALEIPQNDLPPPRVGRIRGHRGARRGNRRDNVYNLPRAAAMENPPVIDQPAGRRPRGRPPRAARGREPQANLPPVVEASAHDQPVVIDVDGKNCKNSNV